MEHQVAADLNEFHNHNSQSWIWEHRGMMMVDHHHHFLRPDHWRRNRWNTQTLTSLYHDTGHGREMHLRIVLTIEVHDREMIDRSLNKMKCTGHALEIDHQEGTEKLFQKMMRIDLNDHTGRAQEMMCRMKEIDGGGTNPRRTHLTHYQEDATDTGQGQEMTTLRPGGAVTMSHNSLTKIRGAIQEGFAEATLNGAQAHHR